jgi:hypothetical protein
VALVAAGQLVERLADRGPDGLAPVHELPLRADVVVEVLEELPWYLDADLGHTSFTVSRRDWVLPGRSVLAG